MRMYFVQLFPGWGTHLQIYLNAESDIDAEAEAWARWCAIDNLSDQQIEDGPRHICSLRVPSVEAGKPFDAFYQEMRDEVIKVWPALDAMPTV